MKPLFIVLVGIIFLGFFICECSKAKSRAKSQRREAPTLGTVSQTNPPAGGPPPVIAAGGNVTGIDPPKEFVDLDATAMMVPDIPPALASKPQIIIQRETIHKSESYHQELASEEKCKMKQGYLLKEKRIEESNFFEIFVKLIF